MNPRPNIRRIDTTTLMNARIEAQWQPTAPPRRPRDEQFLVEVISWCIVASLLLASVILVVR